MKNSFSTVALAGALLLPAAGAQAQTAAESDNWKFSLMPYLWLPTIDTKLNLGPVAASRLESDISVAPSDWLPDLKMAGLLAGEARYGKWLLAGDYIYLNLGNADSHINTRNLGPGPVQIVDIGSDTSLKTTIWSIVGGYSDYSTPAASVDLIAGVR